jgi:NAD(P)-dependent dehydrogenase (short-subunit alcohol dehydrogenase family)
MAVNAMTETLAEGVKPFGVRVHLLIPGRAPETRFGDNAFPHLRGRDNPDYAPMIERIVASMRDSSGPTTRPSDVTGAIWGIVGELAANQPNASERLSKRGTQWWRWSIAGTQIG